MGAGFFSENLVVLDFFLARDDDPISEGERRVADRLDEGVVGVVGVTGGTAVGVIDEGGIFVGDDVVNNGIDCDGN